jgi:hypothetical protein
MKKAVKFIFFILLGFIVASNATLVFASSAYKNSYLPLNQVWMQSEIDVSRTGNYSTMFIHVYVVCKPSGYADYTKCRFMLYHPTTPNLPISSSTTYTETYSYYKAINEGYLSLSTFDICVSGNNPDLDAMVYYYYSGR